MDITRYCRIPDIFLVSCYISTVNTVDTSPLSLFSFRVGGMTCENCQSRIENKLKNMDGVADASVSYETGAAKVTYNASVLSVGEIQTAVESLGYTVQTEKDSRAAMRGQTALRVAGVLAVILALSVLLQLFGTSKLAAAFPIAETGMSYGMLFVIGLLTSVHCIGMCGGINLSQTLKDNHPHYPLSTNHYSLLLPAFLYNGGRLISYTAVGAAVGALGSAVTLSGRFQGAVQLVAGVFMLIMGINMLGLFPSLRRIVPRLPKFFTTKVNEGRAGRGPLIVGFLNGFMPCGPLQAMQLYALSTGSPARGGLAMFLFCLGTIPLMFALGAAGGILSGAKGRNISRRVMQAGAVLVAAMGVAMFANGWSLSGFTGPLEEAAAVFRPAAGGAFSPVIRNGAQVVQSTLLPNRYPAIVVRQGIPVRWTISAPQGSINGCNDRMIIREYGIEHTFSYGDNVIEFMPARTGRFGYSCWMGMIRSSITVLAEGESLADIPEPDAAPVPAGVEIPTDDVALAQVKGRIQAVEVRLTDDGFEPAIVVMQRRLVAMWNISIDSDDPGNSNLVFPAYFTVLPMRQGDNSIQIMPEEDFEFSTFDNVFYGYVKVVDDIAYVDIDAVKAEVAGFETLIYPESHFESAADGGCACCQ